MTPEPTNRPCARQSGYCILVALLADHLPDPDGAVSQNHYNGRPCPTPLVGYAVDAACKFLGGLNCASAGGGRRVANRTVSWSTPTDLNMQPCWGEPRAGA